MTDWVLRLIDAGGYWGIALLMVLENVFPPIPSELIMGIGGIRVGPSADLVRYAAGQVAALEPLEWLKVNQRGLRVTGKKIDGGDDE